MDGNPSGRERALTLVEAAVDTLHSAIVAERAGAGRIELCASLHDGGTTPSAGLIGAVKARVRIPVFVLIRPRGGDFVYSDTDVDVMRRDIDVARAHNADGIVIGALDDRGEIDVQKIRELLVSAGEMPATFHRAFDVTPDLAESIEKLIEAGLSRVLTSGGAPTALQGAPRLARLVAQAGTRITVMAGGGIREHNVREIIATSGVHEVHARVSCISRSGARAVTTKLRLRKDFPEDEGSWEEIDEARLRRLVIDSGTDTRKT